MFSENKNVARRDSLSFPSGIKSQEEAKSCDEKSATNSSEIAIRVQNLSKCYPIYDKPHDRLKQSLYPRLQRLVGRPPKQYHREFWALKDVSFEVRKGETVGIIGRNGSGKSTLLQLICGTLAPTTGEIQINGRVAALLELGAGFNPEFTGRENIYMNATILGLTEAEIGAKYDAIVAFADIGDFVEMPVKTYSSGMFARLAFATAVHMDPKILIVDEILAVGDAPFQKKCFNKLYQIRNSGCTILLVSHDSYQIRSICQRAILLESGRRTAFGDPQEVMDRYHQSLVPHSEMPSTDSVKPSLQDKFSVTIDQVLLLDSKGDPCNNFSSGDDVELRFDYRIIGYEFLDKVTFVANLYRSDRVYVFGTTTLMSGIEPVKAKDKGSVFIKFPRLNLLSGTYVWRVAVNEDRELCILAEATPVCEFKIRDNFSSVGLVNLQHEWRFS